MSSNQGAKDHHHKPVPPETLKGAGSDKTPHVTNRFVNPGPTKNLRGVEPNVAKHKGKPTPKPAVSAHTHENAVNMPGDGNEEAY